MYRLCLDSELSTTLKDASTELLEDMLSLARWLLASVLFSLACVSERGAGTGAGSAGECCTVLAYTLGRAPVFS